MQIKTRYKLKIYMIKLINNVQKNFVLQEIIIGKVKESNLVAKYEYRKKKNSVKYYEILKSTVQTRLSVQIGCS